MNKQLPQDHVISSSFVLALLVVVSGMLVMPPLSAHSPQMSGELHAMNEMIIQTGQMAEELCPESQTAKEISEIVSIIRQDGIEAWSLVPELIVELQALQAEDGDISVLHQMYETSRSMELLYEHFSAPPADGYISDQRQIVESIPALNLRGHGIDRSAVETRPEEHFEETPYSKIKGKVLDQIVKLDVDADLKLLDFNIARDISLGASYKWGLEPSYEDGYFTRIDAYRLRGNVKIGDMIKAALGSSLPVYMNLTGDQQIIFARQFKSQVKAATALPYSPTRLPINAENAMKMNVGDFVSIPAKMSIVVGASTGFGGGLTASARTYYLISGDFRVNILKIDEHQVRVRLIGMRQGGAGASASVGYGFNLFGIRIVDRVVGNILDTNLFRIDHRDINGENFSVDYIFNMRHNDAKEAYNKFLNANLKFRVLPTVNPFSSQEEAAETFFNNLAFAENLHLQDRGLSDGQRRVTRVFKASNFFEQTSSNIKIGFNLIRFVRGRRWIENHLSVYDRDNIMSRYFVPVSQAHRENRFLFGLFRARTTLNAYSLLDTDHNWNITGMNTLAYTYSVYDKKQYARQYRKTRNSVFNVLGDFAATSGLMINMPESDSAIENFRLNLKVILSDETVRGLLTRGRISEEQFWEAMYPTMLAYQNELYLRVNHGNQDDDGYWQVNSSRFGPAKRRLFEHFRRSRWDVDKWRSLERFERNFFDAVNERTPKDRVSAYLRLYHNQFSRPFLMRFSLEAAKRAGIPVICRFHLNVRGQGIPNYQLSFGEARLDDRLYHEINTIISHITDTSYDMFEVVEQAQSSAADSDSSTGGFSNDPWNLY